MSVFSKYADENQKATMYSYKLSPEQKQALNDLNSKSYSLKEDYVDFTKKYYDWNEKDKNLNLLELQNRKYYIALAGLCLVPLRNGINKRAVATSIGMYAVLAIMNPNMSKEIPRMVKQSMYPYFDKMSEMFPNSRFATKLQQQKQGILIDKNHGRLPFTPETAALYKLAFIEKAYDDIREDPRREAEIMAGYEGAVSSLENLCERDGVAPKEVSRHMSGLIAMRLQNDPTYNRYFAELSTPNDMPPRAFVNQQLNPETGEIKIFPTKDDEGRNVYMTDADGRTYTGDFSLRPMYEDDSYKTQMYMMCKGHVDGITNVKDFNEYFADVDIGLGLKQHKLQEMYYDDKGLFGVNRNTDNSSLKDYSDIASRICVMQWFLDDTKGVGSENAVKDKEEAMHVLAVALRDHYKDSSMAKGIQDNDDKAWLGLALDESKKQFASCVDKNRRHTSQSTWSAGREQSAQASDDEQKGQSSTRQRGSKIGRDATTEEEYEAYEAQAFEAAMDMG